MDLQRKLKWAKRPLGDAMFSVRLDLSSHTTGKSVWLVEEGLMTISAIFFALNFGVAMDVTVNFLISSLKNHQLASCVREKSLFLACSPLSRMGVASKTLQFDN